MADRMAVATTIATAIAVLVIILLFVWPGFATFNGTCPLSQGPTVNVDGRNYRCDNIDVRTPILFCPGSIANATGNASAVIVVFGGFTFHVILESCGFVGGTLVSVTEPYGTTFFGGTEFGGYYGNVHPLWIAPDNESGIYQADFADTNLSLLVQVGS